MKRTTTTVLALALTAALGSSFASAQQYGNGPGRYDNDYRSEYRDDDYRSEYRHDDDRRGAEGVRTDVAQVTRVVRYSDPYRSFQREQCWNEQSKRYDDDYYRDDNGRLYRDDGRNNNTGIVVGAIVGGALGHQVGKGDGRRAATIAGAVIGGAVGHNIDRNDGDHEYRGNDGIVRRCRTVEGMGNRHRRDGFEVTYRYAGQSYQAYMQRNPGRTIRVLVDVSPLENEVGIRR